MISASTAIEDVLTISENFYTDFGGHGKVFKQVQIALIFTTGEIIHADAMVESVLKRDGIEPTAKLFHNHFDTVEFNPRQRGERMMALMKKPLSALTPEQMGRLKENLAQAKRSLAVTALRRLLLTPPASPHGSPREPRR